MSKTNKKLNPIHPGEILAQDFMVPRKLTANSLALALRIPANRLSEIVRGRRAITADTALRLSRYFDTSADLWLGLQLEYDLRVARATIGARIERDVQRGNTLTETA
jgi:addiction module HigA family antidote